MWLGWVLCCKVSHRLHSGCWPGLGSHLKVELEKDVPLRSCGCWQRSAPRGMLDGGPQFLAGCWPEITLSSLPCGPFHHGSSLYQSVVADDARDP